jgi:ubiquinone/menaquinone biosynthesis C-methylase UbiE
MNHIAVPARSKFQIHQVFSSNPVGFYELLEKHIPGEKMNEIKALVPELLRQEKNDFYIYNELKRFFTEREKITSNRSNSRLRQINFLFNLPDFKTLYEQTSSRFKYLDLGGGDGSITSAIANKLNLSKDRSINADVDEWFSNILPKDLQSDITYVTINEYGRLPFRDEEFSLVTAFQSLHHIEDFEVRIEELKRITRKGGFLLIREHDVFNSYTQMLVDIDHSLYEVSTNKDFNNYLNEYNAYYQSKNKWTQLLSSHFTFIDGINYGNKTYKNPTRIYYALYRKK